MPSHPTLDLDPVELSDKFDRTPFGFSHQLHTLPCFAPDRLAQLASQYAGHPADYFVAGSAPTPGTVFYDVETKPDSPADALARLDETPTRVLLKRPENHDPGFRDLIEGLFAGIAAAQGRIKRDEIIRLESAILITSAAATTPFHFDPETNFFCQIAGPKTYHLYPPDVVSEAELEGFYRQGIIDIAQIDLATRDPAREFVFDLRPGMGLHQPRNSPHWVQTHAERSVSYALVFETRASRRQGRAHGANHYLRRIGLHPTRPSGETAVDAIKAAALQAASKVRRSLA